MALRPQGEMARGSALAEHEGAVQGGDLPLLGIGAVGAQGGVHPLVRLHGVVLLVERREVGGRLPLVVGGRTGLTMGWGGGQV